MARYACVLLAFACLLLSGEAVTTRSRLQALAVESESSSESPLNRVVQLLKEMKEQLETEAAADEEAYEKMTCWCVTNEKLKKQAIEDADQAIDEYLAEIESLSAQSGEGSVKIAQLKKVVDEQKAALKQATAIREKEQGALMASEKDLVESITILKNALLVLGRHQAGLVQMTPAVQESINSALRSVALKREELLDMGMEGLALVQKPQPEKASFLQAAEKTATRTAAEDLVLTALQTHGGDSGSVLPVEYAVRVLERAAAAAEKASPQASFAQQPAHLQPYAPQSSQIFGVLDQMKEEMEANLKDAQQKQAAGEAAYAELKPAAEEQIASSEVLLDDLEVRHSATLMALANAKEELETTRETRAADVEFLSNLRVKCQTIDQDWEERTHARGEEIKAVGEAIVILTEDDARDLFSKKYGSANGDSFIQMKAKESSEAAMARLRAGASSQLMNAARKLMGGPDSWQDMDKAWNVGEVKPHEQLAALAMTVRLDAFTKVKASIDAMVADLKAQQEEEVAHKANCTAELNENEKLTYDSNQELGDVKDKIAELEETIRTLAAEIIEANETISRTEVELKAASILRKSENAEFAEEIMDQRAVQMILKKAMARLEVVYKTGAALAQQDPNPPVQFQPYKQNAGGSPVLSLLEQVIGDSAKVEQDTIAAEQEAQSAYETFANDSDTAIKMLLKSIETKQKAKVMATADLGAAEADKTSVESRLEDLAGTAEALHLGCDFTMKNFDIRQKARLQEIEALQAVKGFLNGMVVDEPQKEE